MMWTAAGSDLNGRQFWHGQGGPPHIAPSTDKGALFRPSRQCYTRQRRHPSCPHPLRGHCPAVTAVSLLPHAASVATLFSGWTGAPTRGAVGVVNPVTDVAVHRDNNGRARLPCRSRALIVA